MQSFSETGTKALLSHRALSRLVLSLALVLLVAGCGNGKHSSRARATTTTVRTDQPTSYTLHTAAPGLGPPVCGIPGRCLFPSTWTSTAGGDWTGTLVAAGPAALDPVDPGKGYAGTSTWIFSGTVKGCGQGTAVVRTISNLAGSGLTDSWEVVPGFGAGALSRLAGGGQGHGNRHPDLSYDDTFAGRINCTAGDAPQTTPGGSEPAFVLEGPAVSLGQGNCNGENRCVLPFSQSVEATGKWSGRAAVAGAIVLGNPATRFAESTTMIFEGTVEACGMGTAVIRRTETGVAGTTELVGTWEVAKGFGTGGLARLSGHGNVGPHQAAAGRTASAFVGQFDCAS